MRRVTVTRWIWFAKTSPVSGKLARPQLKMKSAALVQLENIDVRLGGRTVLRDISWRWQSGQHWAVLGPNGAGKSTFLKLVRGEVWPVPGGSGRRLYTLDHSSHDCPAVARGHIACVSPETQERYLRQDWTLNGRQIVQTGFFDSDLLYQKPEAAQKRRAEALLEELQLQTLGRKKIQEMSQGELRKILVARALVSRPRLLLLDECCDGLDAGARGQLLELLQRIAGQGTQLLYTTHRDEEIIPAVSHVLWLEGGRIIAARPRRARASSAAPTDVRPVPAARKLVAPVRRRRVPPFLIRVRKASVYLGRKKILHGLDWQMNAAENWAVLGRNGAGKSTFLKLIAGDLHPARGGRIEHFDHPDTLWKIRRRIGWVSADFQAAYEAELTGEQVICSGFFSSVGLLDRVSPRQRLRARVLIRQFRLGALAGKSFPEMSYGERRKILLARALAQQPDILILDEPFDGLDQATKSGVRQMLETLSRNGTRLVMVTHHLGDLPDCMTHVLRLENGRIVGQGSLSGQAALACA